MKMEQTECSKTSAYKFQTPGNHPKESIQHSVHGKSLKSRLILNLRILMLNAGWDGLRKLMVTVRDGGGGVSWVSWWSGRQ